MGNLQRCGLLHCPPTYLPSDPQKARLNIDEIQALPSKKKTRQLFKMTPPPGKERQPFQRKTHSAAKTERERERERERGGGGGGEGGGGGDWLDKVERWELWE